MQFLPEALVERLQTRQAVLVAGLGCSALSGLPGWPALCERLLDWVDGDDDKQAVRAWVERGQIATALALLRAIVPEEALVEVLRDAYPVATTVPAPVRALAKAPFRGIVTTALDALFAHALADEPDLANRIVFASSASGLEGGRGRFLLQLLGRPDQPASLCLAPSEIGAKIVATGAANFVAGLHKKWSLVFVGFSPSDPDLALLAGRVLGASTSTLEHFFVAPGLSALDARLVQTEFGLRPVSVEGGLEDVVTALVQASTQSADKPPVDDVEAWLERLTSDPADEQAQSMLEQGMAKLHEDKDWERLVAALVSRVEIAQNPKEQAADLYEAGMVLDKELQAPDRAYPVLMMALRLTPQDPGLLADAKRVAESAGQGKEFLEELHEIEKEAGDVQEAGQAPGQMTLGVALMLAAEPERQGEAIAAFQKVLDRDPANLEAVDGIEILLRKAGRWNDLRSLFEKAVERDPTARTLSAKLEDVYQHLGQTPQLIELLQARIARDPDDAEAIAKLEDIYQQGQRWQPLSALYERMLGKNPDDRAVEDKLEAIYQKTQQWQPLGALYERRLAGNPGDSEVMDKIESLYRKSDQWRPLADLLDKRAQHKTADEARALRLERASILLDKLRDLDGALQVARAIVKDDPATAEEIFAKCLEREPNQPGALAALADLARNKGDYLRAAKFVLDAAERTQNPLELGRLLAEAGTIQQDHLEDEGKATELYQRALTADPEQERAAERLLGLHEKAENWAGAEPLLDLRVRKTDDADAGTKADLYRRLARAARQQGKRDKAITALATAGKLTETSAADAIELGDLYVERESWADARAQYERARTLQSETASPGERASLWAKIARCSLQLDDVETALEQYQKALLLDPEKRETMETVIALHSAGEHWKEVVELKRRLLALLSSDEDKVRLLEDIGDVLHEKLDDWPQAMAAYDEALALQPDRRQVLYKVLDYHTQDKAWPSAVATLEKLAGLEEDAHGRAKLHYAVAAIHRDELADAGKAVEMFSKVLDDSPLYPKAFEAIEKLLGGEDKDLKELERAYRKQIKRLPTDAPHDMKLRLWDSLADVALRMHDKESAALTMEVAVSMDRDNFARQERLAKMYFDLGPSGADKAIAQHQYLLSKQPDRIDSYKALAALFFQAGAHDKMWCVAGAMTCLGKADPPLQALYENFRPSQTPNVSGKLNEELWRKILHPDESAYLDALFALLSPAIAMTSAQSHKVMGLDKSAKVDVAGNNWSYAAALRYVATTVEMPLPDVFVKRDVPGTVSLVNLKEKNTLAPALVIGSGFDQLSSQSQVIFDLAKRMVLLRPERFPRFALGTPSALDIAARAGLQIGGAPIGPGEHGEAVDKMAKQLDGYLSAPLRAELKSLSKKYVEACGNSIDIAQWIVATDLTASRAAMALSGDIVAAARVLALEPSGQSPMPLQDRVRDLLAFFVSEGHFAVRAALGMQVNLTPPSDPSAPHKRRMSHMQIKTQG